MSCVVACTSSSGSGSGNPAAPASGDSTAPSQNGGSYQLDPAVTTLRFNADAASVDLTAQEGAQAISVTEQTRGATTTKEVTGTTAVLTSRCPDGINFGDSCRVDYKVTIPARVAVDIEGAAGDIMITGPIRTATVKTAAARITGRVSAPGHSRRRQRPERSSWPSPARRLRCRSRAPPDRSH